VRSTHLKIVSMQVGPLRPDDNICNMGKSVPPPIKARKARERAFPSSSLVLVAAPPSTTLCFFPQVSEEQPWIPTRCCLLSISPSKIFDFSSFMRRSDLVFFCPLPRFLMQHRPSSTSNAGIWTTNSGAPVWNNNSSLTVGQRGQHHTSWLWHVCDLDCFFLSLHIHMPVQRD
jgi:hypothetical protein